jgi:hypothetical protein
MPRTFGARYGESTEAAGPIQRSLKNLTPSSKEILVMGNNRERSLACDLTTDEQLAALATRPPDTEPDTHELSTEDLRSLAVELQNRRKADPTLDELTALVDVRDRLVRIVASNLLDGTCPDLQRDPNARLAKKYLDRVLMAFLEPLMDRGNRRSPP